MAAVVAELEGKETTQLSALYDQVDSVVEEIFSNPSSPEAQIQMTFTFEGYRISINQDGSATFLRIE